MKIGIKLKKLKPPGGVWGGVLGGLPFLSIYFGHRIRTWVGIKEVGVFIK